MNLFEYINKNIETVKTLVKAGVLQCSLMNHFAVYSRFEYYIRQGYFRSHAASFTAHDKKISERGVYRIIERMEGDI